MLDWIIRWGIPMLLLALAAVFADSRMHDANFAQPALEAFRQAVLGLIPRFF